MFVVQGLASDRDVVNSYLASQPSYQIVRECNYGTMLLVKAHLQPEFYWAELFSEQGRGISSGIVTLRGGQKLFVGTVRRKVQGAAALAHTHARFHPRACALTRSLLLDPTRRCTWRARTTTKCGWSS